MISTKRPPDPGEGRRPLSQSNMARSSACINSPDYVDSQGRDTIYNSEPEPKISFSVVSKDHGNLTKVIRMEQSKLVKDSSACSMSTGSIKTVECTIPIFAKSIRKFKPNEALVHGISEFSEALVVVKGKYEEVKKSSSGNKPVISRTKDHLHYPIGPGLLMLDHDEPRSNAVAAYDKAKFYWNNGINPIIHSFCHGSVKYTFERFEEGPEWSFDDAETVLVNVEDCSNSKDRMDLANDILQHSSFEAFEIDIIRNLIKKHLHLNKGTQDKVIKSLKFEEYDEDEDTPDPTHWEIAKTYIEDNLPNYPQVVGAEGALWVFSPKNGLYEEFPLTKVEDLVGQDFCGNNCKKGADYKSIARIIYNKLFQKDFFGDAPYGIAALSKFILIDKGGSIRTELYRPDHRQRYKLAVVPYKLAAPLFFKYLEDTFAGDDFDRNIVLLQEIMGGLVIGCFNKLQRAVLLLGSGSNGKSVLLELLENMFPPGLKSAVSPNDFDGEYYRAELAGKVINIVGELDKTKFLRSIFKDVIGCDTSISARLPYKDPFSFKPTAAHIFASNHFSPTKDHSHGFYRRG